MITIEQIKQNEENYRKEHKKFVNDLSSHLLPRLFIESGFADYQVKNKFIEPKGNPPREEISPDLVVYYFTPSSDSNLLIVEAKINISHNSRQKLDEWLAYSRRFADSIQGRESLHYLLGGEIPMETLASCGMISAGVFATKQGGFRLYRSQRLR